MSMSAALRDRLIAAGVAGGSVFRDERPQGTQLPAVRLQVVSDPRSSTHDGREQIRETTIQADCMADSRGAADEIAEAVITAAEPAGIVSGIQFLRAFVDSVRTYSERADTGPTTFVTSLDLRVWHQPAA